VGEHACRCALPQERAACHSCGKSMRIASRMHRIRKM
jgi:hypothetical protein